MSIQVTPIPRLTVLTVPAFTLGTANAAGSAVTSIASDSTLLAFDTTLPDAITFGQSGAVGSSTTAARRSHAHAMAADPSPSAASEAEMKAASSTTVFDTPGRTKYHPGVAKIWASWSFSGGGSATLIASYNYTSVTQGGATGDADHLWNVDFSGSTVYALLGTAGQDRICCPQNGTLAAGGVTTITRSVDGTAVDSGDNFLAGFGDQ